MMNQHAAPISAAPPTEATPATDQLPVVVYSANSELVHPWHLVRDLLRDVVRGRELGWRLFLRNLQSQYRQTLLGYFWAIMPPLVTTLVWVGLRSMDVVSFAAAPGVPYAAYVLTGTILWQTFLNSLTSPITSIETSKDMLAKLNFPREAVLMAGFGQMLFNLLIQLVLLAVLLAVLRAPAADRPALPRRPGHDHHAGPGDRADAHAAGAALHRHPQGHPGIRALRDVPHPRAVRAADPGALATLNMINPVAPVLVAARDWLLVGPTTHLAGFLVYSAFGLAATLLGLILVRIAMPFLIERMGS